MTANQTHSNSYILLSDVLSKLALKGYQMKLFIGARDTINGYGWHTRYYIEINECIEFCPKCRSKYNVDYNDNEYPLRHQHSHHKEYKTILAKEFMSEYDMCIELNNLI
jgi:hypothetical protein